MEISSAAVTRARTHTRTVPARSVRTAPPRRHVRERIRTLPALSGFGPRAWALAALVVASLLWIPILVVGAHVLTPAGETWSHLVDTVLFRYIGNSALLVAGRSEEHTSELQSRENLVCRLLLEKKKKKTKKEIKKQL